MKQTAIIAGVGMTQFGRHQNLGLGALSHIAINEALLDAGISADKIEAAWCGTAGAAIITGQVCIPGQAILRQIGIGKIPVVNVENACATSSTAFQQAASMVTLGAYDIVLAFGVEKLYHEDKSKPMSVYAGCIDVETRNALEDFLVSDLSEKEKACAKYGVRSLFMDIYAKLAREYMSNTGATERDFAEISAKNSVHGSMNPNAQFRDVLSVEEVLAARPVVSPLTLPMCSPIGDGAAAAIIVSEKMAKKLGILSPIRVLSSVVGSGYDFNKGEIAPAKYFSEIAYNEAGISPSDINVVELHDATSPAELLNYEELGLCGKGEGPQFLRSGATRIGGKCPVNTSGGLVRKGHPIGATGLGQIYELVTQLRARAGARQVEGARFALAENGGGFIGRDAAAMCVSILAK